MSYDDKVFERAIGNARATNAQNRIDALRSIPDGTAKINGCFVKVKRLTDPYDIDAALAEHRAIYIEAEDSE